MYEALYASVLDPSRLQEFSTGLIAATGSHIASMMIHDPQVGNGRLDSLVGADPEFLSAYEREFAADNIWVQRGGAKLVAGAVSHTDEVLSRAELRRSRYYNEFLRLVDIEQSVALCAYRDSRSIVTTTVCRSAKLPPYSDESLALMRRVAPHLVNSHAIRRRLGLLEHQLHSMEQALHALPTAMLLLDKERRVRRMNAAADALFEAGWLMRGKHGLAAKGCDARVWERVIGEACRGHSAEGGTRRASGKILLRDVTGQPMLVVAMHPLPAASPLVSRDGEAAVLFVQSVVAKGSRSLRAALMELFDLTLAEAALAVALLARQDLEEAASACGIVIGTARTRLKSIFGKTGERSQVGLVRLLSVMVSVTGSDAGEG